MATAAEIESALRAELPAALHTHISVLAQILADAADGTLSPAETEARLADPALAPLLEALAGRRIETDRVALTFAGDSQLPGAGPNDRPGEMQTVGTSAVGSTDQRQGAFISGGIVIGTVIGVNQGTIIINPQLSIPPPPEPDRPPEVSGFVGREAELTYFAEKLATGHLAVITGMPGVGKTTLAAALARQVADPTRIFWHAFHENEGIAVIIWKLAGFLASHGQGELWRMLNSAQQMGGQPPPSEVLFDFLTQTIRGQGYLICLDDVQFVEDDPLLDQLVEHLRGDFLIVASRHIPVFMEQIESAALAGLSVAETGHLLAARGLSLSDKLVADLYAQTGGNTQFLTLAIAALQRSSDPARLIARLVEAGDIERYLLTQVDKRLTEDERAVMHAVAVLLGYGGTRDAIETVLDRGGVRRTLSDLSSRNLLTVSEGGAGKEYVQHTIVRAFYYELLSKRERQTMHRRAGQYYETEELDTLKAARHFERAGEYAHAADLATADVLAMINQGQARPLRQLLESFTAQQMDMDRWIGITMALGRVYRLLRARKLAQESYQAALTHLATLPDSPTVRERRARVCNEMGEMLRYASPQEALQWLHRGMEVLADSLPPSPRSEHSLEEGLLQLTLGAVLCDRGEYIAAARALERSLSLLPEGSNQWYGTALMNLGSTYLYQYDFQRAKDYYLRALEIYQQAHSYWRIASIWLNLGLVMEATGDWIGAADQYQRASALAERLGHIADQTLSELNLGNLRIKQGDAEAATKHLTMCLELAHDHNLNGYIVAGQSTLADLHVRLKTWETAERLLIDAERLALEADTKYVLPEIYRSWAQVRLARGELTAALEDAERALRQAGDLEDQREQGMSLRVLGQILLATDRNEQAIAAFERSLSLLTDRDPYEVARTKTQWGRTLLPGTDATRGAVLLREARATFAWLGAQRDLAEIDDIRES